MYLNHHFRLLDSNLTLDASRIARARAAYDQLRDGLASTLRDDLVECFLQGAYRNDTLIRPDRAVDAIVVVRFDASATPSGAIDWLRERVAQLPSYAERVVPRARCVRLHCDGGLHLDLVPARLAGAIIEVPERDRTRWRATNPKGLAEWYREQHKRTEGRFGRVARMVKYWCNEHVEDALRPPSLALEVLLSNYVCSEGPDAESLLRVLRGLTGALEHQRPVVPNPSFPSEDLACEWSRASAVRFGQRVARASALAAAALNAADFGTSIELWRQLFRDRFPASA